jgi:sigma-B regulation protein RsbU (phosphoserine phosphatase)
MRDDLGRRPHSGAQSGTRGRIFVVDDDVDSRRFLARSLEATGYTVLEAADGAHALAAISEVLPDLILLDASLPNLNGAQMCAHVRAEANPAVNEIPVILLTTQDDEEAEARCLDAGANDFLGKPVSHAALTARIQTQLRLRAMSLELRAQNEQLARWHDHQLADLESARITQRAIIPAYVPTLEGWEIEKHFSPVIQVGGDVYGWRALNGNCCILWMADATGHGASAALMTALIALLFQQAAHVTHEPRSILRQVNAEFFGLFHGKSFISACCAFLDSDGRATLSSAGHPPVLVVRRDGHVESVMSHATVVGISGDLPTGESSVQLERGEVLLLFTDGLYSLRHPSGDRMMYPMVSEALSPVTASRPLIPVLLDRMQACSDGQPFDDDVTVVAARRLGPR